MGSRERIEEVETELAPIAGVSLELYAEVCRGLAEYNYEQSQGPQIAANKGITVENWATAVEGWNQRIAHDRAIARRFNNLYMAR